MRKKIVAVIPARMASSRFPGKVLLNIKGLPMLEHVRRRALISSKIDDVYVATCDPEIASVVEGFGGKVIMTNKNHSNGTSRVSEAVKKISCTHVVLLQGDEPLLLPRHIDLMVSSIENNPDSVMWNAIAPMNKIDELNRHSFVKCLVSNKNKILFCFRRSPLYGSVELQVSYVKKMLGIIAYDKNYLISMGDSKPTKIELLESIEQMRVIEEGGEIVGVLVEPSLPSINQPDEVDEVLDILENSDEQISLLKAIKNAR